MDFERMLSKQEKTAINTERFVPTEELVKHNKRLAVEFAQNPETVAEVAFILQESVVEKILDVETWSEKIALAEKWLEKDFNRKKLPDHVVEHEQPIFFVALAHELAKPEYNQ